MASDIKLSLDSPPIVLSAHIQSNCFRVLPALYLLFIGTLSGIVCNSVRDSGLQTLQPTLLALDMVNLCITQYMYQLFYVYHTTLEVEYLPGKYLGPVRWSWKDVSKGCNYFNKLGCSFPMFLWGTVFLCSPKVQLYLLCVCNLAKNSIEFCQILLTSLG